jgi:hypothetical protein
MAPESAAKKMKITAAMHIKLKASVMSLKYKGNRFLT